MMIAYTMSPGRGDTDLLLSRFAQVLEGRGLTTCGVVQTNTERPDAGPCDMDVKVLPVGPVLRISQTLGRESRGCRLDAQVLEHAVGLVEGRLCAEVDCLIINKFGKHEAEGRGFRSAVAQAVALDIPVLVGVNALNKDAFLEFSGGCAVQVVPEEEVLFEWLDRALACRSVAA